MRRFRILAVVLATSAIFTVAQGQSRPAPGLYACPEERVFLSGCDQLCSVSYPDRPLRNGFTPQATVEPPELAAKLKACTLKEAKGAPQQAAPAASAAGQRRSGDPEIDAFGAFVGSVLQEAGKPRSSPPPVPDGPRLEGEYVVQSGTGVRLEFNPYTVVVHCDFGRRAEGYSISEKSGVRTILIGTQPQPMTLTIQPDGSLRGPARLSTTSDVQVGVNSRSVSSSAAPNCPPGEGYASCMRSNVGPIRETRVDSPVYETRTVECPVGQLRRTARAP